MKVNQMETACTKNTRTPELPGTPEQPKNPIRVRVRVWAGVTLTLTLTGFFSCCGVSVFWCSWFEYMPMETGPLSDEDTEGAVT